MDTSQTLNARVFFCANRKKKNGTICARVGLEWKQRNSVYIRETERLKSIVSNMKFVYIYITIIFFSCSCEDELVKAIAVLNENGTIIERPTGLIQPRILIARVDANSTDQSSESPQILPVVTSLEITDANEEVANNLGETTFDMTH